MPFISDPQLERLRSQYQSAQRAKERVKERAQKAAQQAMAVVEIGGTGALMGYARGQVEGRGNKFEVFGMAPDMILGLGLIGSAFFGLFGKYDDDMLNVGAAAVGTFGAFAMRDLGFEAGKQGKFFGETMVGRYPQIGQGSMTVGQGAMSVGGHFRPSFADRRRQTRNARFGEGMTESELLADLSRM